MIGKLQFNGLPLANVAAASVATGNITPGRTLEKISYKLGGTFVKATHISLLKLKANGKVFFEGSGADIDKINAYRGIVASAAFLDIDFTEQNGRDRLDRLVGAFDTSMGINNITSEITIGAATSPTLSVLLSESGRQVDAQTGLPSKFAGLMHKVLRYPFSQAVGGTLPVTLPFGPQNGAIIKRVHVATAGGLMTGATVKQDRMVIHESLAAENSFEQTRRGLVPQTNWYTIDFIIDGELDKALDSRDCDSLEWLFTFSGAESGYIYVEYLDRLGNL